MNLTEAERLISKWRKAKERVDIFMRIVEEISTNNNQPKLYAGQAHLPLDKNEFLMIKNILDNMICEREQNLREQMKDLLNIDEVV